MQLPLQLIESPVQVVVHAPVAGAGSQEVRHRAGRLGDLRRTLLVAGSKAQFQQLLHRHELEQRLTAQTKALGEKIKGYESELALHRESEWVGYECVSNCRWDIL